MNYHITTSDDDLLTIIYKNGLRPSIGKNSESVNDLRKDKEPKLCFSQGYIGEILMASCFYSRFTYDKSCGIDYDEFVKKYDIMLAFDENLVENENIADIKNSKREKIGEMPDIADGHTTKEEGIAPSKLKVAFLKDKAGNRIYDTIEIVKYMMSQISAKEVMQNSSYLAYAIPYKYLEEEGISDKKFEYFLHEFYQRNIEDIEKYKNGEYILEYQDYKEYCNEEKGIYDWTLTGEEKAKAKAKAKANPRPELATGYKEREETEK